MKNKYLLKRCFSIQKNQHRDRPNYKVFVKENEKKN